MVGAVLDFRLLFESSPDVLLVLLPDAPRYTMVAATEARLAATHTTREQIIGQGLFEVFPDNPDDPEATGTANLRASLERVVATRAPDTMAVQKYDIRMPDGTFAVKYWSPKNLPVLTPSGEIAYILHRVEDVTELVLASELGERLRDQTTAMEREVLQRSRELAAANRELREANARLGELDAAKTAFFSNISHEFRTPLTLMLGPLEDLFADRAEPLGPRQRERVVLIRDSALRLHKLVNALLEVSRVEAGRAHARFAPVDLPRLTAELAGMFETATDSAGLRLTVDCPPASEPAWVDPDMWERIVPNLVSNALKFTFSGEIAVRLREHEDRFELEVADTGTGIPAEQLDHIFDRFHRVPGATGRTHEGSGIGLALVRELVGLHGGRVSVESELGRGSTFRVAIPKGAGHLPAGSVADVTALAAETAHRVAASHALEAARWLERDPAGAAAPDGEPARPRVLVADDNPDLRAYMRGLLLPHYEVTTAVDGQAALEAVTASPPDLVLSDVMMPRLDGFGLVRALRARPATATIPIVLLSARAGEEAAVEGLDTGADDYLIKPFSARELIARVRTHLDLARRRREYVERLEHANRELDAFSYSVSHDLRAPLRAIDGFARALLEDAGHTIGVTGLAHIERISSAARRMSTLIEALLDLARVGRQPLRAVDLDLAELASAVLADLSRAHPGRAVDVVIERPLRARGDRALLEVVLDNLLRNAWKFTARAASPRIEVGRLPARQPTFFVRDNGAGFDPGRAAGVFAPFQRFHDASDFEGTGVGLATVQRVIARHGGRLHVESAPGAGATFSFSLP